VVKTHLVKASQLLVQTEQAVAEEVNLLGFEDATHVHLHSSLAGTGLLASVWEQNSREVL